MIPKSLSEVRIFDIQSLCDNRVIESRVLDFKNAAIGHGDREKREFLSDISAFANAAGGDLVLGVATKDGVADSVNGILLADPDKEKLRLVSIARDGLEPRISGIDIAWLPIEGQRGVMLIRVSRSWSGPHRVTFLRDMNFYTRNPAGKNPMSVDEIRRLFNSSRDIVDRLRTFRSERINAITTKELPLDIIAGPKLILHIVPLSAVVEPLDIHFDRKYTELISPLKSMPFSGRHSLEGYVNFTQPPSASYTLTFRDGTIEAVAGIERRHVSGEISLIDFEKYVLKGWRDFHKFSRFFGVTPPVLIFATLIDVLGLGPKYSDAGVGFETPVPSRRNIINLPEVFVGTDIFHLTHSQLFRRLFDATANAFGLSQSQSYNADGNYIM